MNIYVLEKTHFRIIALRPSKAAPTLDVLFSNRCRVTRQQYIKNPISSKTIVG